MEVFLFWQSCTRAHGWRFHVICPAISVCLVTGIQIGSFQRDLFHNSCSRQRLGYFFIYFFGSIFLGDKLRVEIAKLFELYSDTFPTKQSSLYPSLQENAFTETFRVGH